MLKEVYDRLAEENLKLTLTNAALEFLVEKGYDEKFGARPLRRAIQRYIEDPLSERILAREFPAGEEIEVDVTPAGDSFEFRVLSTKT
jgi:ATP-dependent Clp protease ATP-binding subunit ClpC